MRGSSVGSRRSVFYYATLVIAKVDDVVGKLLKEGRGKRSVIGMWRETSLLITMKPAIGCTPALVVEDLRSTDLGSTLTGGSIRRSHEIEVMMGLNHLLERHHS
ncbi:hypothetical protein BHM03_00026517 [Ensete ventricosum]|nr:hypothetical protein BHM03_00026517 [Ensete ventricosum]